MALSAAQLLDILTKHAGIPPLEAAQIVNDGLPLTGGVGFYGDAPVAVQPVAIADAAGGATVDTEARAALNALLAVCRANGFIDT